MQKVKWIKITTDIFDDEKIQLIEVLPDSDTIIVIWFKLLALAGKSNNSGLVLISDKVPYTKEMLSIIFRRKKSQIELALKTFVSFGMIELLNNDAILISNWEKHQNIKGLDNIKEQNRIRQQRFRDNKKLLLENKDIELDKDIDKEGNVTNNVTIKPKKKFVIPTIKQLEEYCNERKNKVNPEAFIDHYISKDWKAAVRTWERNNFNNVKDTKEEDIYDYLPRKES